MTDPPSFVVISGSARDQRIGPLLAEWVVGELQGLAGEGARVELVDAGDVELPPHADLQPGVSAGGGLARLIDAADGYVVVTPEYNHGYPASLKQLIDGHYREWMFKPAALVGYGVSGGVLAAEQLRSVFAELHVVTTRKVVAISSPWTRLAGGRFTPEPGERDALATAWSELRWWATALQRQRTLEPYGAARAGAA